VCVLAAAGLAATGIDALAIVHRLHRVDIPQVATSAEGETWVIVGSDDRSQLPEGRNRYGTGGAEEGAPGRADVVIAVHVTPERVTAVSIPRDMEVAQAEGLPTRLTLTLMNGPESLVTGLCTTLGIPTDHLVVVTMKAMSEMVDALGGIEVDIPVTVRDRMTHLSLEAGRHRIDGMTALALVRSRHPEYLVDGEWNPADAVAGGRARTATAGLVLSAAARAARSAARNPMAVQRLAWAASGTVTVDRYTSLFDATALADAAVRTPVELPAAATGVETLVQADESTEEALRAAGYSIDGCHPS
jgi:LCP family protein required for cell wall assembly